MEGKSRFQTELEENLTDLSLVGNTQHFVCGALNFDFMIANSVSQTLENFFACSEMTMKLRKPLRDESIIVAVRFSFDVISATCEISRSGIVSSTLSDHEVVYAVIGDDSVKQC